MGMVPPNRPMGGRPLRTHAGPHDLRRVGLRDQDEGVRPVRGDWPPDPKLKKVGMDWTDHAEAREPKLEPPKPPEPQTMLVAQSGVDPYRSPPVRVRMVKVKRIKLVKEGKVRSGVNFLLILTVSLLTALLFRGWPVHPLIPLVVILAYAQEHLVIREEHVEENKLWRSRWRSFWRSLRSGR